MRAPCLILALLWLSVGASGPTVGQTTRNEAIEIAIRQLSADSGGAARVHEHRALGNARFIQVTPGSLALGGATVAEKSNEFFRNYGASLGVLDPDQQLHPLRQSADRLGHAHISYEQRHGGLPVFAGIVRTHFDAAGDLIAVNGTFVPDIAVSTSPGVSRSRAAAIAIRDVAKRLEPSIDSPLRAQDATLMIFRSGLLQRSAGRDHLVYHVEVSGDHDIREFVFVDAHSGVIVERISGTHSAIQRTVHEPDFNNVVIWNEGDSLPYTTGTPANDDQVNGLIDETDRVYDFFLNLSGGTYRAWDGADSTMHTIWNASFINCPNASWNGNSTNYCDGVASDDVIAHEWAHAYTQATHNLIYQWQSGALNEAYSDIFGETIDRLNGAGTDTPEPTRTAGDCSVFSGSPPPTLTVTAPASIAGDLGVAGAAFNPAPPASVTSAVIQADDGAGATNGCAPLSGFPPGRIALIDRGTCPFADKATNAQNAGASAMILVNSADSVFSMPGSGTFTIPSVMVSSSTGATLKAELSNNVVATISLSAASANSLRWLIGEDSASFGTAIRDMWNPTCKGDPDRVPSPFYTCGSADSGGVHTNSGVPNHAFSLIVDGGTFNGRIIAPLGVIKAVHLYWRAMAVYQVPDSGFADHETAITQSCDDLLGINLVDPLSGGLSGEILTASDCSHVTAAMQAVEMSAEPPCNFQPLLVPNPPAASCGAVSLIDDFETADNVWTLSNLGVFAEYAPRDWLRTTSVPAGGNGFAYFGIDSLNIGNCTAGDDDQSGAMRLDSPLLTLGGSPNLIFDHYVATEGGFDGGNLKISVNGGPFQLVAASEFSFNPYNQTLVIDGNTNPLAGEEAFAGSDGGVPSGTWGQSHVSLSSYAGAADTVQLRFEFGVDGCNGLDGWYIDNVLLCTDEQGAGSVPSGGGASTALTLGKLAAGLLDLTWGDSCAAGDTDYAIYEGATGSFDSHVPLTCTTGGLTQFQGAVSSGDQYFLVVPRNASREGSYGTDSAGDARSVSAAECVPQALALECL